jgi:excisionase family DNA binding protein
MATGVHLTTVEASNLAGVGPSTVKRWADQGLLPCVRTAGGHRRFERFALERFLREQTGGPGQSEALLAPWVELLINGRRHEVDALLLEARARLGAWHRVADEVGSLLTKLGEQWAGGLLTIAEEHLVSDGLTRALGRMAQALPTRAQGPRCVLACAEGDEHTLGLSLAELCLVELGWTPLWLGARTPTVETIRMAEKSGARMVAMSASAASRDAALLGRIASQVGAECGPHDIDFVLGGEGAWPETPTYGVRLRSFGAFHEHVSRHEHGTTQGHERRRMT